MNAVVARMPFHTWKELPSLVFTDDVGVTWEIRDYAAEQRTTDDEAGVALKYQQVHARDQFEDTRRFGVFDQAKVIEEATAQNYEVYRVGHPRAERRVFIPRHRPGDQHENRRVCDLHAVADHRWYPATIERQWRSEHRWQLVPEVDHLPAVETADSCRLVPLTEQRDGYVFANDDGHLWRIQDLRYRGSVQKVIVYEPAENLSCTQRRFRPWEHEACERIYAFSADPRERDLGGNVTTQFTLARPSGSPRDYSREVSGA